MVCYFNLQVEDTLKAVLLLLRQFVTGKRHTLHWVICVSDFEGAIGYFCTQGAKKVGDCLKKFLVGL